MAKKTYRVRNWNEYNRSLVNRGSITFWFSEDALAKWCEESEQKRRGRPRYYGAMSILCGLTLRQLYRLPLRATQGLLHSLMKLSKWELKIPNYSTLCRRSKSLSIKLKVPSPHQARHVLIDSTGVQVLGEGEWKTLKHGASRYQVWRKLHIVMDADKGWILNATMSESERLDSHYLRELLEPVAGRIERIIGDGAYDKKDCYRVAHERGAQGVFPPQHNAIVQRNKLKREPALLARDKTIRTIARYKQHQGSEGLAHWKKEVGYHQRSRIEALMWRMKSIFGDELRSRSYENQRTDLRVRCYAMNKITSLGMPHSVVVE